jgi:hypothetical protein
MKMSSSGMLRRVNLVITDVSEECGASIIRVTRFGELGTTLAVISNLSSETFVSTRATRRNIPESQLNSYETHLSRKPLFHVNMWERTDRDIPINPAIIHDNTNNTFLPLLSKPWLQCPDQC